LTRKLRWLFSSKGAPIAFVDEAGHVFTAKGRPFGEIDGDNEVWHGRYLGEVTLDDRLLFDPSKARRRVRPHGGTPAHPIGVSRPPARGAMRRPDHLHDIELPDDSAITT
jgi:hypothetical protein